MQSRCPPGRAIRARSNPVATAAWAAIIAVATLAAYSMGTYARPQKLVAITGARRLNLYCTGTGAPTIILISGLGLKYTGTLVWYKVQPQVQRLTRVCSYDRAGLGFSDAGPFPRTASANANDLHELLEKAGVRPPYVLVAHSLGGYDARLFADRYRADVAAMVFVDPIAESFTAALERRDKDEIGHYQQVAACEQMAQRGSLRTLDTHHRCIGPNGSGAIAEDDPQLGTAVNRAVDRILQSPVPWKTYLSEATSASFISTKDRSDELQIASAQRSYGTMPLIVLTAAETYSGIDEKQWIASHARLAALSSRGVNCVVPSVGHFIQIERPNTVVSAIAQTIVMTKSSAAPHCLTR